MTIGPDDDEWRGVFVERSGGLIIAEYANRQPGYAEEAIAEDDPELIAFRSPGPSLADVVRERERRLALGFDYDFGDVRGIHRIGTTARDMLGWREVTDLANALLADDDTTTVIAIVSDTGPATVTAPEWAAVLRASAAFRQPLWAASFALQAADPIPADYAADIWWEGV